MTCKMCGEDCQGRLCSFHAREQARDGDWQDRLEDAGDLPQEDPMAFLGPDVHKCDPCDRVFGSIQALANHDCASQGPADVQPGASASGVATTQTGPSPTSQQHRGIEPAQSGGDSP